MDAYIPFPDALMRLPVSANRQWDEFTRASGPAPYNVRVVAKLKPGVTMAKARAEMEITYARTMEESRRASSDPQDGLRLHFASLKEVVAGDAGRSLFVLTIGVGFVLLIACANIANLLLSRASTQNREAAIRTAIGASGARLLRQLLTESLVLALIGGTIGLFVARAAIVLMVRIAPQAVPRLEEANLDSRVLGFTLAASLAAGVLFGLRTRIDCPARRPQQHPEIGCGNDACERGPHEDSRPSGDGEGYFRGRAAYRSRPHVEELLAHEFERARFYSRENSGVESPAFRSAIHRRGQRKPGISTSCFVASRQHRACWRPALRRRRSIYPSRWER